MATATRARTARRAATKRTILSALDENQPANDAKVPSKTKASSSRNNNVEDGYDNMDTITSNRPFRIPNDFDGTSTESLHILMNDLESEVKRKQENIRIQSFEAIKRQHEAFFLNSLKIDKNVKKMKICDFNHKYMEKGDNLNKTETCIIALMMSLMVNNNGGSSAAMNKKRIRNSGPGPSKMDLETPCRPLRVGRNIKTPGTVLRTAKKGEQLLSANGSPIEQCEEGALVATVAKKRRANGKLEPASFDININGQVISLSDDPNAMNDLSDEMKTTVSAQLNVLQDQLARMMSQIEKSKNLS